MRDRPTWVHEIGADGRVIATVEGVQPTHASVAETAAIVAQLRALADNIETRDLPEFVEVTDADIQVREREPSNVE